MSSYLVTKFRQELNKQLEDTRYAISNGAASDLLVYKEVCAQIKGIEIALSIFNDVVKSLDEKEEA